MTNAAALPDAAAPDPAHFARAVTQFGEKRPVVVSSAIYNTQGLKIIDKGVVVDARLYEKLTRHRPKVPLAECLSSEPPVTGQALVDGALQLAAEHPFFATMLAEPATRALLLEELRLVPLPHAVAFQVTLMRETQPMLWQHSLRTALTAAWLGTGGGASRYDVRLLAAAGLVHDLGMLHLDPVLLQPEVELDRDHRRQLYTHPLVSAMVLDRYPSDYPREVLAAVLEHHEALDGSGYPRQRAGAAISPWGRVLALAEVVTAMFGPHHPAPVLQLSFVLKMNQHRFDAALVRQVMPLLQAVREPWRSPLAEQPLALLGEVHRLLQACPAQPPAPLPPPRAEALAAVLDHRDQLLRVIAGAGASPAQLAMLGDAAADPEFAAELALIGHEAVWQLRAVTREARRRWRLAGGEVPPPWLQPWLEEADGFCARHLNAPADPTSG